jgi:hypothetical protein
MAKQKNAAVILLGQLRETIQDGPCFVASMHIYLRSHVTLQRINNHQPSAGPVKGLVEKVDVRKTNAPLFLSTLCC